ncbi:kinesin-like protein KIF26A isoform X3 [Gasterosteus aculeatus]
MYSQYWDAHRPDHRRYAVVEGRTLLPLDSPLTRKRLRSAGEEEDARGCGTRPNPKGSQSAGELSHSQEEEEPEEELCRLCQRCHIVASQLNRQAAALKDLSYASLFLEKLQRPRLGRHVPVDSCCDVCGASFHQLRRVASGGGARWGGVRSTYLGGGGAKGFATVTPPFPLSAQCHLEGVWSVSCCSPELQGRTTDGSHVTHSVSTQTSQQASTFFSRAAQKLSLSRRRKSPSGSDPAAGAEREPLLYNGGFSRALQVSPPPVPPCLLRARSKVKDTPGMGKVRVMVRISSVHSSGFSESMSLLKVDSKKKLLTLYETPSVGLAAAQRRGSASVPKCFTFDTVFSQDASQAEVCSGAVCDVIQSVVNGADGCIFCFGHAQLGKTYTMIGQDGSAQSLGVAPTAISWLFKVMEERRQKFGTLFSVGASAVEISGREETLSDLLAGLACSSPSAGGRQEAPGPSVSLREDPLCGSQLQNQTELRANNAEQAAFLLDAALAARRSSRAPSDQEARRNSHFMFTLHLQRERPDEVSAGSRLHLLDLGSCETEVSRTREGGGGRCLSLSSLGNVVLALANGAAHVPYRDSKLVMLLGESLGNINCRTTMVAHVSNSLTDYMETLRTLQLASRIHHTGKKKSKVPPCSSRLLFKHASSSSGGDSSCEEGGPSHRPPHLRPLHPKIVALDPDKPLLLSSNPDYSSSSEHSCDTVIYVGRRGVAVPDRELSNSERPPSFIPIVPSLTKKWFKDGHRPTGNHFKCNTFAELQERLEYIDDSEGSNIRAEGKPSRATKPTETTSPTGSGDVSSLELPATNTTDLTTLPPVLMDTSKRTSADRVKLLAADHLCVVKAGGGSPQEWDPGWRKKVYLRGGVPKPLAFPSLPRTSQKAAGRDPPMGVSQPAQRRGHLLGSPNMEQAHSVQASLFGEDLLRTAVTLQRPVELNGEDELVFTVVEELPLVPDNGGTSNMLVIASDCSLRRSSFGSRPVPVISSMNDEYAAFTSQMGDKALDDASGITSASVFQEQRFLWCSAAGSLSEPYCDSSPTFFTEWPPSPDSSGGPLNKDSLQVSAGAPNALVWDHTPYTANCSSPTPEPTSTAAAFCDKQEGRRNDVSLPESSRFEGEVGFLCTGRPPSGVCSKEPRGNTNSVPPLTRATALPAAQRVVDGCERPSRGGATLVKLLRLTQGATTMGIISAPQSSESKCGRDGATVRGTLRFSSLGKKWNRQKGSAISRSGSGNITPPVLLCKQSSQEQKMTTALSPSALKTRGDKTLTSEEEFNVRLWSNSFSHRKSSLKMRRGFDRTQGSRSASSRFFGSLMSVEGHSSQTSAGSGMSTEYRAPSSATSSRSSQSAPRLGVPASSSICGFSSQVPPGVFSATSKTLPVKCSSSRAAKSTGLKVQSLSRGGSRSPSSFPKPLNNVAERGTRPPSCSKTPSRSKGAGNVQAVGRAPISRVSELASGGQRKRLAGRSRETGNGSSSSEAGGSPSNMPPVPPAPPSPAPPSPYSKITAPRRPQCYSSGHGSDNSSVLSAELPPAVERTALFHHSRGSSGYDSVREDSETTGSASSESPASSSFSRRRASKPQKKRGSGFLRRRLIPAILLDASSPGRKRGAQWVDQRFEIKVYEIDNVERLQRRSGELVTGSEGLLHFNARLRMLEKRQQQITELKSKHQRLMKELQETKTWLMLDASKWSGKFNVDQDLYRESQEYLEALAQATAELDYCVNLCKSRVMMETCFDIAGTTVVVTQGGPQEAEV